jgi:hypothetical protein
VSPSPQIRKAVEIDACRRRRPGVALGSKRGALRSASSVTRRRCHVVDRNDRGRGSRPKCAQKENYRRAIGVRFCRRNARQNFFYRPQRALIKARRETVDSQIGRCLRRATANAISPACRSRKFRRTVARTRCAPSSDIQRGTGRRSFELSRGIAGELHARRRRIAFGRVPSYCRVRRTTSCLSR